MQKSTESRNTPRAGRIAALRGLGRREDLDLDFHTGPRSVLVTRLLARCLAPDAGEPEDAALRLTLAGRTGGLLSIYALTWDTAELPVTLRCAPGCGGTFEVRLPLRPLIALAEDAERVPVVELARPGAAPLRVRRPTGDDQSRWRTRRYASAEEAQRAILESLAPQADVTPAELDLPALGAAMEEADPLPVFRVAARCPSCGAESSSELDLESLLIERFRRRQRAMLAEVHRLASRYGWTEAQVFEVPEWRRREYLRMIDGEGSA